METQRVLLYRGLRKSLTSKNRKSKSSSSPPRSTVPDIDLDSRFVT